MSGRQLFALSFGWLMNTRKENEYITKLVLAFDKMCVVNTVTLKFGRCGQLSRLQV